MASMHRRAGCANWYAFFTLPNGQRTCRSLGTADKETAKRLLHEIEESLRLARRKSLDEGRAVEAIRSIYRVANEGRDLPSASLESWLTGWLNRKRPELAPGSFPEYKSAVGHLLRFLGADASKPLSFFTPDRAVAFRSSLLETKGPGTTRKLCKILSSAWALALRERVASENPWARVGALRNDRENVRRPFTLEEIRKLLHESQGSEWHGLILFGFYTGQRLGDIARLTWGNVDLSKLELRFVASKTGRRMILPLAEPLRDYLLSLPGSDRADAPIFPRSAELARDRVGTLSNQFADLLARCGMREAVSREGRGVGRGGRRQANALSFHCLRHTATTALKAAGTPHAVAQALIGHESEAVSANYTHIDVATLRGAIARLPILDGGTR